jgi:hypothetical protein
VGTFPKPPCGVRLQNQRPLVKRSKEVSVDLNDLPVKVAPADTDGINNALDLLATTREDAQDVARFLTEQPQDVIRRVLNLNRYQRAGLGELTPEELQELVNPVVKVLQSDEAGKMRGLKLVEEIVKQSPVRIRCRIEIDW